MSLFPNVLVLVIFLQANEVLSQVCEPIEEGKPVSFTCTDTSTCSSPLKFWWRVISPSKHVSYCDTSLDCTGNNEFFSINAVKNDDGSLESKLTIHKVSRTQPFNNEVQWRCENCGRVKRYCNLKIYVKPVNVACRAIEVFGNDGVLSKFTLRCTMEKVYPSEKCLFRLDTGSGSAILPRQTSFLCTYTFDVSTLRAGRNVFSATVSSTLQPNFDQLQPTPVTPDVVLRLPKSKIECSVENKDGYYKGEIVSCICVLVDRGKPEGRATFFEGRKEHRPYVASHPPRAVNVTCAGESAIGRESPGNMFFPKFAFLKPNAVVLKNVYENGPDNSSNAAVLATCEIATSDVNPSPRIVFLVDGKEEFRSPAKNAANGAGSVYRSSFLFHPKVGGSFKLACRVENSVFSDLVDEVAAKDIIIYSPVQLSEAFEISQIYYANVDPGNKFTTTIDITAYPRPQNFTLFRGSPSQNITADNSQVQYLERSPSAGTVELTLRVESLSDLALYTLVMDNGIGDRLVYSFTIEEDTDEDKTYVYIIVGVVVGVILIVAVALLLWWRKRRTKSDNGTTDASNPIGQNNEGYKKEHGYNETGEEFDDEDPYEAIPDEKAKPPAVNVSIPPPPQPKNPMANVDNKNKRSLESVAGVTAKQNSKANDSVDAPKPTTKPKRKAQKEEQRYVNLKSKNCNPNVSRRVRTAPSAEELNTNWKIGRAHKTGAAGPQEDEEDYLNLEDSGNAEDADYITIGEELSDAVLY